MALGRVAAEARAFVHSENAVDAADDTADNSTDRSSRALAIARAALDTTRYALSGGNDRHGNDGADGSNQKTTTYLHFISILL
jgi:hypothetical protein